MVFFKPLFILVPESTSQSVRIMLLKATHAPLLVIVWLFEQWEAFALKRAALTLSANMLGGTATNVAPNEMQHDNRDSKAKVTLNKKHSLKKTGPVHVPTALLTSAQLRPSKATGPPQQDGTVPPTNLGRAATGATTMSPGVPMHVGTALSSKISTSASKQSVDAAGLAELMQMMKDLSAQVEEVRAALVKHDEGPGE